MKRFLFLFMVLMSCSSADDDSARTFQRVLDKKSTNEVNESYLQICAHLDSARRAFAVELKNASTKKEKSAIYDRARALLIRTFSDSLFVCWYGTEWDFNGTTTKPRQGEIACGYFVTTLVRDAGFRIDRVALAQCASQSMIYTLCPDDDVKIITGGQVAKVKEHLLSKNDGIFLIGLDTHTGFVVKQGNELRVVHSNYTMAADGVVSEPFDGATVINYNHYFVIGDFLSSDTTIDKWIKGTEYTSE